MIHIRQNGHLPTGFYPDTNQRICTSSTFSALITFLVASSFLSGCSSYRTVQLHSSDVWHQTGEAIWTFRNDEWTGVVTEGAGFLTSRQTWTDFTLELEFYPDSTINSGVFIRCRNEQINPVNCYEVNIWDLHPVQNYRTGAIVNRALPRRHLDTINRWNRYKITLEGNRIRVWLNGRLTADLEDTDLSGGTIALQAMGTGTIRFRNIRISSY